MRVLVLDSCVVPSNHARRPQSQRSGALNRFQHGDHCPSTGEPVREPQGSSGTGAHCKPRLHSSEGSLQLCECGGTLGMVSKYRLITVIKQLSESRASDHISK